MNAFGVLGVVSLLFLAAAPALAQEGPRDVLKPGTVFRFVRTDTVVAGASVNSTREFTQTIKGVGDAGVHIVEVGRSGPQERTVMSDLRFPLVPGRKWEHLVEYDQGGSHFVRRGDYEVIALETLTLLGRSVPAYRIEVTGWFNQQLPSRVNPVTWRYGQTFWYAPSLGYVVKARSWGKNANGSIENDNSYELKQLEEAASVAKVGE